MADEELGESQCDGEVDIDGECLDHCVCFYEDDMRECCDCGETRD